MNDLLAEIVSGHGGLDQWRSVRMIEADFSAGGFAFAARCQPFALSNLRVSIMPHSRRLVLSDYCHPGWRGFWTTNSVEIRNADNRMVVKRLEPRREFSGLRRQLWWDKLDLLYFTGYALWNYLTFPFILLERGVTVVHCENMDGDAMKRLAVRFNEQLPTHSEYQEFHINENGLLIRHDYIADVIGSLASAANFCLASEIIDGFRFYTRREVYPRIGGDIVLPWPKLVGIELNDLRIIRMTDQSHEVER